MANRLEECRPGATRFARTRYGGDRDPNDDARHAIHCPMADLVELAPVLEAITE